MVQPKFSYMTAFEAILKKSLEKYAKFKQPEQ
jgi:hypothetical protein